MASLAQIRKKGKVATNPTIFKIETHGTALCFFQNFELTKCFYWFTTETKVESTVYCFQTFPVRYCIKTCKRIFAIKSSESNDTRNADTSVVRALN